MIDKPFSVLLAWLYCSTIDTSTFFCQKYSPSENFFLCNYYHYYYSDSLVTEDGGLVTFASAVSVNRRRYTVVDKTGIAWSSVISQILALFSSEELQSRKALILVLISDIIIRCMQNEVMYLIVTCVNAINVAFLEI